MLKYTQDMVINMRDIRKIFYEGIVPEAAMGKINVFFNYSVAFSTNIVPLNKQYNCNIDNKELQIPTLIIKDKELFDSLLTEYVYKALEFYDDNNFYDEVKNCKYDDKYMICKEKLLLMCLFVNATVEDFNNPIDFLRKRIAFFDNYNDKRIVLGYSDSLKANVDLIRCKDTINNEGTEQFVVKAYDEKEKYIFPRVKFGISDDKVYVYAIQNEDKNEGELSKKINRKLYKVGEGFTDRGGDENPKDITASFLVVLNMFMAYFNSLGYTKFIIPTMLNIRYNSKKLIHHAKYQYGRIDIDKKNNLDMQLDNIQSNLTNKLIRTFLRLACHYNNIDVISFPYELDSALHIEVNNNTLVKCNNRLLYETSELVTSNMNHQLRDK